MIKQICLTCILLLLQIDNKASDLNIVDSLELVYKKGNTSGIERLDLLRNLALNTSNEKSIKYAIELVELAEGSNNNIYAYRGYNIKGRSHLLNGDLKLALESFMKAKESASLVEDKKFMGGALLALADVYSEIGNYDLSQKYYSRSIEILRSAKDSMTLVGALLNAGDDAYKFGVKRAKNIELKNISLNKALKYYNESDSILKSIDFPLGKAYNLGNMGMVYSEQREDILAEKYLSEALNILNALEEHNALPVYLNTLAEIYLRRKNYASALTYSLRSLDIAKKYDYKDQISKSNQTLSLIYQQLGDYKSSLQYFQDHIAYRDSIINLESVQSLGNLRADYEIAQKQIEVTLLEQKRNNQKLISTAIAIVCIFITILAILLYRRYYFIKEYNQIVEQERDKLENALNELKNMQAHLIQQEKLASFGQLTAGIAHEIKNPLNFINNFSELSMELIDEEKIERSKNETSEENDYKILDSIYLNLSKIYEHGMRANGIINSMLQFSKDGSGKKENVFFNEIIKEYVSLCYQGLSVGKNPLVCNFEYDLDVLIQEVPVFKEDFIRVIINICNNAFDAMRTKLTDSVGQPYQPKLTIVTKKEDQHIYLIFKDNGPGIPHEIIDKIFQPFFTTKKGTKGTGLGLSITNDIIEKHGGELSVKTVVGKCTEFTICLAA